MAIVTEKATILTRRGLKKDFDPDQMTAGEWAVSIDTAKENQIVWMCFAPGVVKRMGTYDDFQNAIQDISDDIADVYIQAFDEIKASMEQLEAQTEAYKNTASQKATEAAASAQTATTQAGQAASSASMAAAKADAAADSAGDAQDYATEAESYAHGGTGTRPGEDADNAKKYYEQAKDISQSLSGTLKPKGTIAFADIPALSAAEDGWMYNISDQFTTTADFKEGAGHAIPDGANVYKTMDGKWDILAGTPVTGVKGAKESAYRTGNVNITPENIGTPSTDETYLLKGGASILKGEDLYADKFKIPGNYFCPSIALAKTLLNCPLSTAFTMKVDYGTGRSIPRQIFYPYQMQYTNPRIVIRTFEGGKWSADTVIPVMKDINATNTTATDTHALLGVAGADSNVQALIDEIADRVIDKLLTKDDAASKYALKRLLGVTESSGMTNIEYSFPDVDTGASGINMGTSDIVTALRDSSSKMADEILKLRNMSYLLKGGTEIPANADMNADAYKIPGNYYCPLTTTAETIQNLPLTLKQAFILKVDYPTGVSGYVRQIFIGWETMETMRRIYYSYNNTWSGALFMLRSADVVNDFTHTDATLPLSANMGRLLKQDIESISDFTSELLTKNNNIINAGYLYAYRLGKLCVVTFDINVTAYSSTYRYQLASGLPASNGLFASAAFNKYTGKSYSIWIEGTQLLLYAFEDLRNVDLQGQLVYLVNE